MSATLYTIIGLIIAAVGTIGYPMWRNRKKDKNAAAESAALDSRSVAGMFKEERDRLQLRVDTMAAAHQRQIRDLRAEYDAALARVEAKWKVQHEADQAQIAELRTEVHGLYRQLNSQRPGP